MSNSLLTFDPDSPEAEYNAKLIFTSKTLLRFLDQAIGMINMSSEGDVPEEDAMAEITKLTESFSKLIVDDISPKKSIIT